MADAYDPDRVRSGGYHRGGSWSSLFVRLGTAALRLFGWAAVGFIGLGGSVRRL